LTQYNTNIKASLNTTILLRIHDVISITHPYLISKPFLNKILFRKLVNNSIKSNPFLIFNSNTTKNEFNKYFEIKPDKEVVIYCVSEFKESNLNKLTEINKKINGEYISFCSSIEPKKNIKTLIDAFRMSRMNNKNLKLVIIGRYGWKSSWFFNELKKDKNIIWINSANDSERDILINKSKCFVFPSIIEGFGMPVIEALRLKVPVITSNIDIFKEIAGDSIFTASTFDIKGISDRINFVINPLNKNIIKDKVEFGFQISKKYTLEKVNNSWNNLLVTLSKNG